MEEKKNLVISAEHLTYVYEDAADAQDAPPAVSDVSFSVEKGEYIAILGHNGSGKSTLAKLCNMILTPTEGRLFILGREVTAEGFSEEDTFDLRAEIGMVFQNPDNQLVATVVEEDVAFGPENLGLPREEIRRRVNGALAAVGMEEYAHHAPHKLSGGQKQRIAIAGILAMKPSVILFDESTSMLDPLGRAEVVSIMERLNREDGITVVHITHYMDEAARASRVIVMNDGRIAFDGTPREVFKNVDQLRALGLEAPQGVELLYELARAGMPHKGDPLTEQECIDALAEMLGGDVCV
ncbi:MAG: energy-coupling factor transporter ATPase [Clostridia bacterium]|nr:energy-coupling factor transporter ATPase [Clostridia bacterium]